MVIVKYRTPSKRNGHHGSCNNLEPHDSNHLFYSNIGFFEEFWITIDGFNHV